MVQALIVALRPQGLEGLARSLRRHGLAPIVAPSVAHALRLVAASRPGVAIVEAAVLEEGRLESRALLRGLERSEIPVVLVGIPRDLGRVGGMGAVVAALPASPEPEEVAEAAALALGEGGLESPPGAIEAGPLHLDVGERRAYVEGRAVDLPPREFAILVELACRRGRPMSGVDLARRIWRLGPPPVDAVHRAVYRLRIRIGDHQRVPPLILNRRGFGYVLNLSGAERPGGGSGGDDARPTPFPRGRGGVQMDRRAGRSAS